MLAWFQRRKIRRLARKVGSRLRDAHGNHLYYPLATVRSVCRELGIQEKAQQDAIAMFAEPEKASAHLGGNREERRSKLVAAMFRKKGPVAESSLSNCFHDPDDEIRAGLRQFQGHGSPVDHSGTNDMPSSNATSGQGASD